MAFRDILMLKGSDILIDFPPDEGEHRHNFVSYDYKLFTRMADLRIIKVSRKGRKNYVSMTPLGREIRSNLVAINRILPKR